MGDPEKQDVVLSYAVNHDGITAQSKPEYDRLQDLLKKGQRVVDIVSTPGAPGGASSDGGFVCVTVMLTTKTKFEDPYLICHRQTAEMG